MKEQIINIEIRRDGQITANANGFTGDVCLQELERLLEGLTPGSSEVKRKSDDKKASINQGNTQKLGSQL